jgi:lysophospholipase L1-like esterase
MAHHGRRWLTIAAIACSLAAASGSASAATSNRFVDDETDVANLDVPRDRLLVVSLGDSVASGEGNPGTGEWASARCHRSPAAGVEQSVRLLAQTSRRPITFVNLACSGATIDHGLLRSYRGIERPAGAAPVAPQVRTLRRLVKHAGRPADAVLLSIGANDVHFGDVVRHCIAVPSCATSGFDPDHLGRGTTADATVGTALGRLAGRYDALAGHLDQHVVLPGRVFITQYFDPTRNRLGQPCAAILGGIGREELRWAEEAILTPLNQEVTAAARRHGWHAVTGIPGDFATHGYCTDRQDRWVRTVAESLANLTGPLHPNAAGHLAIAARIVPALGPPLGIVVPKRAGEEDDSVRPSATTIVIAVIIAATTVVGMLWRLGLLGLIGAWIARLSFLLRKGRLHEAEAVTPPQLPRLAPQAGGARALVDLVIKLAGVFGTAVVSVGFVVLVGAAIVWVRFWAARYPADQAVDAVGRDELLVIGAQALVLFAILGAVAVVGLWLLDGEGRASRRTRIGLALIVLVELLAAIYLGDFRRRELLYLVAGFAIVAFLAYFLSEVVHRMLVGASWGRRGRWPSYVAGRFFSGRQIERRDGKDRPESRSRFLLRRAWQAVPLLVLAYAVVAAVEVDHASNRFVLVLAPIAVAAVLFVCPWGTVAGAAREAKDPVLRPVRAALAATLALCLTIFLIRDEAWLVGTATAATALAGLCLAIAHTSADRFLPVAVTVMFTVCATGAVVACLRVVDSPQAQPVAMLLKDHRAVCGVWVGESSGRIWYARLKLSELAAVRRPTPRDSGLTSVSHDDVVDMALGPLQPVGRAADQAAALRSALRVEHRWDGPDPGPRCGPLRPRHQQVVHTRERRLAKTVQPELIVDRKDGFWPVSVQTLMSMQDRRARVCRRVADDTCVRVITQADLAFNGGEGEWLDYPANSLHRDDEEELFHDALGSVDPGLNARVYFLVTGGRRQHEPVTVQFWFFYTYNYLLTGGIFKHPAGLHEGDFETVSVLLSADTHKPRYVWMARHKDEGRMFLWDEDQLKQKGGHVVIYAARGSHATYESCRRQDRSIQAPAGLIDDRPQCDEDQELHLPAESTHLIDLSRVSWACWRGRFGEHPGGRLFDHVPYETDDGPRGPLWQQRFGGVVSEPCRGVRDSDDREGDGEEVLSDKVSDRLREGAGRLDPAVDSCSDWERAPSSGALIVACDRRRLTRYLAGGLENPGNGGLRIDVVDGSATRPGAFTVPAVRRDPRVARLDSWRVTASSTTVADVYASCQAHGGLLEARFRAVHLRANVPVRVDDRERGGWRLRDERGAVVGRAMAPHVIKKPRTDRTVACGV